MNQDQKIQELAKLEIAKRTIEHLQLCVEKLELEEFEAEVLKAACAFIVDNAQERLERLKAVHAKQVNDLLKGLCEN